MSAVDWAMDSFVPREDRLLAALSVEDVFAVVEHPEWFRPGDVVRVGDERLEPTGEVDEYGNEIMRSLCEAVSVAAVEDGRLRLYRSWGIAPAQAVKAGERVLVIGGPITISSSSA